MQTTLSAGSKTPLRTTLSIFIAAAMLLLLAGPAAAVTPEEDPDAAAAGWLVTQYQDHPDTFGLGGNAGDIADLIFALAGAGVGRDFGTGTLLPALEAVAADYVSGTGTAALAKTLLAVAAGGGDINAFAGLDLEQQLESKYDSTTGQFEPGDFGPSAFDQSLAILAWAATGDPVPAEALDYLNSLACTNGSFGFGCPGADGDVDSTALAIQALLAGQRDGHDVAAQVTAAADWIVTQQQADGSFGYVDWQSGDFVASPNSTGVAAMSLRAAERPTSVEAATEWLRMQQAGCDAENAGAIGDPQTVFSLESATMQGLLAFAAPPYDQLDLTAADTAVPVVCAQEVADPVTDTSGDDTGALPTTGGDEELLADTGAPMGAALIAALFVLGGAALVRMRPEA
ncbi:MAG: prenyltransferase/squalene oxidase repeat-containing protein [Nitriliruptorales bacterium]|nr:prenyltransferase/squalene oxidase repeat-containing protein [Nitriliruptorales bacterium]